MGRAMVENLHDRGFALSVYNRSAKRLAGLKELGVSVETSPAAVIQNTDCTLVCVADDAATRSIVFDPSMTDDKLSGKYIVDLSSISVALATECFAFFQARNAHYFDAPVSGGVEGAREGTLSVMVGGEQEYFSHILPILNHLAQNVTLVGPAGSGALTKQINQIIVAAYLAGLGEAFALAENLGIDLQILKTAISGGYAQSRVLDAKFQNYVTGQFEPGGRIALHKKDLDNALSVAADHDLKLNLTEVLSGLLSDALEMGYGDLDHSVLFKVLSNKMQDKKAANDR